MKTSTLTTLLCRYSSSSYVHAYGGNLALGLISYARMGALICANTTRKTIYSGITMPARNSATASQSLTSSFARPCHCRSAYRITVIWCTLRPPNDIIVCRRRCSRPAHRKVAHAHIHFRCNSTPEWHTYVLKKTATSLTLWSLARERHANGVVAEMLVGFISNLSGDWQISETARLFLVSHVQCSCSHCRIACVSGMHRIVRYSSRYSRGAIESQSHVSYLSRQLRHPISSHMPCV